MPKDADPTEVFPDPYETPVPQTVGEKVTRARELLAQAADVIPGRLKFLTNMAVIMAVPALYNLAKPKYFPLDGTATKTASEAFKCLGLVSLDLYKFGDIADSYIESIIQGKAEDPNFLLGDKEMEWLRTALYLIDVFGLKLTDFCEFGVTTIEKMKVYVKEYEERKRV